MIKTIGTPIRDFLLEELEEGVTDGFVKSEKQE